MVHVSDKTNLHGEDNILNVGNLFFVHGNEGLALREKLVFQRLDFLVELRMELE